MAVMTAKVAMGQLKAEKAFIFCIQRLPRLYIHIKDQVLRF